MGFKSNMNFLATLGLACILTGSHFSIDMVLSAIERRGVALKPIDRTNRALGQMK